MKKTTLLVLPFCLLIVCGLPGCSKARKTSASPEPPAKPIIGTDATNDPVSIRVKWTVGKKYLFQLEAVQGMDVTLPEPMEPKKMVMGLNHDYAVSVAKRLPDGGRELELEMTAQRFFYQVAERQWLAFDSRQSAAQDAADPVSPLLRKLMGARVRCITDADGGVVKAEGFDALNASLDKGDPQMKAALQSVFSETNLIKLFNAIAAVQPAEPQKIGDSWPVHLELEVPGSASLIVKARCQFADWDVQEGRECIRIEFKGSITSKPEAAGESSLAKIEGGTLSGQAWFDPALGMVINSSSEGHLTMKASALGQTVATRVNASANVRLLSVEDN